MNSAPAQPRLIAHYRVPRAPGSGGMGEGFPAENTKLDRSVALKLLPKEVTANHSAPAQTPELPTKDPP